MYLRTEKYIKIKSMNMFKSRVNTTEGIISKKSTFRLKNKDKKSKLQKKELET